MTLQKIQESLEEVLKAQIDTYELHIGCIFAIAIRLGISHEELIEESAKIIATIENGENPWEQPEQ